MSEDAVLLVGYYVLLGGLGLVVGSFLNVVIYRVPRGLPVVRPSSSYARYPLAEAVAGLVWLGLGLWAIANGDGGIDSLLPWLLGLGSAGVALAFIDLDHHRLPDAIVLPLYPSCLAGLGLAGVLGTHWPVGPALAGGALWVLLIGGIWLVTGGRGMGFGDVKLAPVLGITLGWVSFGASIVGLFSAFVFGSLAGLVLLASGRVSRSSHVPFGPFLLAGAAAGLVVGAPVAGAYADWLGG